MRPPAGRFSFANFYARRMRRIFPALGVVLARGARRRLVPAVRRRLSRGSGIMPRPAPRFASNFAFWREASYFDGAADLKPLLHLWSLGVEEQFYLVWPVLLVMASRWRRGPLAATLVIGTASFLIAIWTVRIDRTAAFYAPWTRFWELLAGALLASVQADAAFDARMRALASRPGLANMRLGGRPRRDRRRRAVDRFLPGVSGSLGAAAGRRHCVADRRRARRAGPTDRCLSQPPSSGIGLISYPLYLWHWPLLSFAQILEGAVPPPSDPARIAGTQRRARVGDLPTHRAADPIRAPRSHRGAGPGRRDDDALCRRRRDRLVRRRDRASRSTAAMPRTSSIITSGCARPASLRRIVESATSWIGRPSTRATRSIRRAPRPGKATPSCYGEIRLPRRCRWASATACPPTASLAQVTTSACKPAIDNFDLTVPERRCEKANRYAMESIGRLRPALVILAQSGEHAATDWEALTARVLALGAAHVFVVGPSPVWRPGLPRIYAEHHMQDHADYVGTGLDMGVFDTDRAVGLRLSGPPARDIRVIARSTLSDRRACRRSGETSGSRLSRARPR